MKTITFTINGDAAAAIDKTIKLRAASPRISNIVEVRIVRSQAGPTPYTLSWDIGPADNVAQYDGASFGIAYIKKKESGYDDGETININTTGSKTVYEGDIVIFWDNCTTSWSATGATFERNERIVIGTSDVHVTGMVPSAEIPQHIVTFITKPMVTAHITYIQNGLQQNTRIDKDSTDKTISVDKNSDLNITYTGTTNYTIDQNERSISMVIDEDTTIEFPTAIYTPPIYAEWDTNSFIGCDDYSLGTPPTNLAGRFKIQEPFLNSMGDEVYQDIEFLLWIDGTNKPAGKPSEYNVTLNNRGTGTPTTDYWAVTDEGSGGGHGKLVLTKNPFDDYTGTSSMQFDGEIILKDPAYNDDAHAIRLWFSILLVK